MEITIKLTRKQMSNVMRAAEAHACKEWFEGDIKKYEEWAGNVVCDTLLTFLDELYIKYDIKITAEGWDLNDYVYDHQPALQTASGTTRKCPHQTL